MLTGWRRDLPKAQLCFILICYPFVMSLETLAYQVRNTLASARRVCFAIHANPDPDAVGSGAALARFCVERGKSCVIYCSTDSDLARQYAPARVDFVCDAGRLPQDIDVLVALDGGDEIFSGAASVRAALAARPTVINIDHHKTNTRYGDCNVIIPGAASTTQIVFHLFKIWRSRVSRDMAECLLMGLLTDTEGFANPATTAVALQDANELVLLGADFFGLQKKFFKNRPLALLRTMGGILRGVGINRRWGCAYAVARKKDFEDAGGESGGFSNIFNALGEGRAAMILKDKGGVIHCSMRTTHPKIDLGKLAQFFGGGGHAKAAGFTVQGEIVSMGEGQYKII